MISKNTAYLPRLDHLRFFAAAIVVTYHYAYGAIAQISDPVVMLLFRDGYSGVSLFMVVTGFILTLICLEKDVKYGSFIYNRLLRIYPLYIVVVLLVSFSAGRQVPLSSFLAMATFTGNLNGVIIPKYTHIWTLMVEFQFYLLFPFLMAFLNRFGAIYLLAVIAVMVAIRTSLLLSDGSVQDAAYWTILGRLDQFAVGMLAAVVFRRRPAWLQGLAWLPAACALLIGWVYLFDRWCGGYYGPGSPSSPSAAWVIGPTCEAAAYAFVVLAYLRFPAGASLQRYLGFVGRALTFLGTISFSIYIWHYPVVQAVQKLALPAFMTWPLSLILVVFPIVILVSSLSYFVIERPFFAMRTVYATARPDAAAAGPRPG